MHPTLHDSVRRYLSSVETGISNDRAERLAAVAEHVVACRERSEPARLTFICTHNSRRSHFGQIWASVAAVRHGVAGVACYSGGTEVTAFNTRAVEAVARAGLDVSRGDGDNPVYQIRYATHGPPLRCWSKRYDDDANPAADFAAVMTCSEADAACPVVAGATRRIALPYDDPKAFDDTPRERDMYDARCRQIAGEMLYVFEEVARRLSLQR